MSVLYVRDVDEETKSLLTKAAAAEGLSATAYVRRMVEEVAERERRREAMRTGFQRLDALRQGVTTAPPGTGAQLVREIREEYERGDAP